MGFPHCRDAKWKITLLGNQSRRLSFFISPPSFHLKQCHLLEAHRCCSQIYCLKILTTLAGQEGRSPRSKWYYKRGQGNTSAAINNLSKQQDSTKDFDQQMKKQPDAMSSASFLYVLCPDEREKKRK
jgi:hypothetical protein